MKKYWIVIIVFFIFVQCERIPSFIAPGTPGRVSIKYVSASSEFENTHIFKAINDSTDAVYYYGYQKESPLYAIQALTDSGWVNTGGWCGTGTSIQKLDRNSNLTYKVWTGDYKTFRAGLYLHNSAGDYSHVVYSKSITVK